MKTDTKYLRDGRSPIPENEVTSKIMSSTKNRNTTPEIILRKGLWASDIRGYKTHWEKIQGRPDICFPSKKIAIFVNSCFWQRCPYCQFPIPKSHSNFWKEKFEKKEVRIRK